MTLDKVFVKFEMDYLVIVLGVIYAINVVNGAKNVALNKPVAHKNTKLAGAEAYKAVDGDIRTDMRFQSCTHTGKYNYPFWYVNLQQQYRIGSVIIYGRTDCCSNRLRNLQLLMKTENTVYSQYGYHSGVVPVPYTFTISPPVWARFVKLVIHAWEYLSLCEVQVMTSLSDLYTTTVNTAGTGTIIQSHIVLSAIQCVVLCHQELLCKGTNVRTLADKTTVCELLSSIEQTEQMDSNVKFYKPYN